MNKFDDETFFPSNMKQVIDVRDFRFEPAFTYPVKGDLLDFDTLRRLKEDTDAYLNYVSRVEGDH